MNRLTVYATRAAIVDGALVIRWDDPVIASVTLDNANLAAIRTAVDRVKGQLSETAQIYISIAGSRPAGYKAWRKAANLLHIVC